MILVPLLLLVVGHATATTNSTGSLGSVVNRRQLAGSSVNYEFHPLPRSNQCLKRSTWSTERYDMATTVHIPRGHCITMDVTGNLTIPHGLEIEGTLRFQNKAHFLHIHTPFVRVFGRLVMQFESSVVSGNPNVRITLIDDDSVDTSFMPLPENELGCSGSSTPERCFVGKKPIVVAGGRLDIRGLPPNCKTWVTLKDVVKRRRLPVQEQAIPPSLCGKPDIVEQFSSQSAGDWSSDANFEINPLNGSFLVTDRNNDSTGASWDLSRVRNCFVPKQTYLFRAKLRTIATSAPSRCATRGESCIKFDTFARIPQRGTLGSRKGTEKQADRREDGSWHTIYSAFAFTEEELQDGALSHRLVISGGETLDLEIDEVSILVPPTFSRPNDICAANLIVNGDATVDHTYPMQSFGGARISVPTSEYFRTDFRANHLASIAAFVEPCLVSGGRYSVSAMVRLRAAVRSSIVMTFRLDLTSGLANKRVVASCPPSAGEWVSCGAEFLVEDQFEPEDLESARLAFETEEGVISPFEVMDWKCEFVEASQPFLILPEDGVDGCWGRNSEILITSHTTRMESAQVRRLATFPVSLGNGSVRVRLDKWIIPPVTEMDQDPFPVEVALLSRNVVFDAEDDPSSDLLGGHLVVLNTPVVAQRIEGVELRNFGRQGELGRYPIHFHMCKDVEGSVVSKNTIRNSNQRCIVVHGSHNMTVSNNVAFETSGHCYMLEDGGELDNTFTGNLGASTRAAKFIVRSFETDRSNPSTFWISNPSNTYVGNVAAGCESSGFWLELNLSVRSPTSSLPTSDGMVPRTMPLGVFRDNVAHSNVRYGFTTFQNTKTYKNGRAGVFFHNSRNLRLQGGIIGDNPVQADLDRADDIEIDGTEVIGNTERFKDIVDVESGVFGGFEQLVGIQLHGFVLDPEDEGATISNVKFDGFENSLAPYTALVDVDPTISSGHFDYWTKISGVQLLGDSRHHTFDFSLASAKGVRDILLHDTDGSMNPNGVSASTKSGIVISNSGEMTAFIDKSACIDRSTRKFLYCRNICLRTFSFYTNPAEPEGVELLVEDINDHSRSFRYSGYYHLETLDDDITPDVFRNTWIKKRRVFAVALPVGDYRASFFAQGEEVWPSFVEETQAPVSCAPFPETDSVSLIRPKTPGGLCKELIKNGDFGLSSTEAPYWLHHEAGIHFLSNGGAGGSNAISDLVHDKTDSYFGQFIDTSCLHRGRQYEFFARVKIENLDDRAFDCGNTNIPCPQLRLRFRPSNEPLGSEKAIIIASSFSLPMQDKIWNILHGTYTVDSRVGLSPSVALTVARGSRDTKLTLDNMSMTIIPKSCDELVFNGDFADGSSLHWNTDSSASLELNVVSGNSVLRMKSRKSTRDSMFQNIHAGCIVEGERFLAFAKVRLLEGNVQKSCDRTKRSGNLACPKFQLQSFVDIGLQTQASHFHFGGQIADFDSGKSSDGWHIMSGIFPGTARDTLSDRTVLRLGDSLNKNIDLMVGNVSITTLPFQCSELLVNGDFEAGETTQFWKRAIFGAGTEVELVTQGTNRVLRLSNRGNSGDGVIQHIDHRCLQSGSSFRSSAKMRLIAESTGVDVDCDPSSKVPSRTCPPVRIVGQKNGVQIVDSLFYVNAARWNNGAVWKQFEVSFQISDELASCDQVWFGVRSFNKDWVLLIDDISLVPDSQ